MSLKIKDVPGNIKDASGTGLLREQPLLRERRGGMAVLVAVLTPILVAFGALAVDTSFHGYRNLLLRQTVQAAGLAAANKLPTYYSTGSPATVINTAQTFTEANMPTAKYGTVVSSVTTSNPDVVLGNWNTTTQVFTSLATSGGTNPDAIRLTGQNTVANGNALQFLFGGFFGRPSVDLTSTVVTSFATAQAYHTIIINDMSQSFSGEIANQQAIDKAILNCVKGSAGSTSKFGVTFANGHSYIYQPLSLAAANYSALKAKIDALDQCGNMAGLPYCGTGSNIASGIYSAIQQFSPAAYAGTRRNIIVITDGVPNASHGEIYLLADGTYSLPTLALPTPLPICVSCSSADLWTMARNQVAAATAAGISISTIYYSGNTSRSDQADYISKLASLVSGGGVALVAPTAAQINTAFAGCPNMPSSLKTVM